MDPGNAQGVTVRLAANLFAALLAGAVGAVPAAAGAPDPAVPLQDGQILDVSAVRLPAEAAGAAATRQILDEVAVTAITYASDGLRVKGYLAVPKEGDHLPAVIFNRGGNRAFAQLSPEDAVRRLGSLARWGYVVAASQYRGNDGGEGKEEFGGAEVDDVLNLIPLLGSLSKVDATRIGMYGASRGGMMTYLALARTDRIAAAVVNSGVTDLADMLARRPEMEDVFLALIPDYGQRKAEVLAPRSAIRWPERLNKTTPILILAGTADWRVHPKQALDMSAALIEAKHPFRLVVFEGGGHGLPEFREDVDRLVHDWLDRYVRDRKPWPGLDPHGD